MNNMNKMNNNNKITDNKSSTLSPAFAAKIAAAGPAKLSKMLANTSKRLNKALDADAPPKRIARIEEQLEAIQAALDAHATEATSLEAPVANAPPKILARIPTLATPRLLAMLAKKSAAHDKAVAKGKTGKIARLSGIIAAIETELAIRDGSMPLSSSSSSSSDSGSASMNMSASASASASASTSTDLDAEDANDCDETNPMAWIVHVPMHVLFRVKSRKAAKAAALAAAGDAERASAIQAHVDAVDAEIAERKASGVGPRNVAAKAAALLDAGEPVPEAILRRLIAVSSARGRKCGKFGKGRKFGHRHGRGPRFGKHAHRHGPPHHAHHHGPPHHAHRHGRGPRFGKHVHHHVTVQFLPGESE
ncbi:uncharacterized protein AMSG_10109 [Thecamonas trahens ATCC 50062]|uniref:Uncharacterized protein n=1 Tax=Thecamonas trahens ATCC 50062 TaxID=461836 RepID=A0A0L0DQ02_THETB|nr:hypothetical protein AMSG_10109 [Thecamonas trahens ATCC 50062]KNC54389.1 hypothetical protein AMSG_10109 [Thecamonas trahens ATCC 50062]|eukprot:XP_013753688.1 hypothetical protein AMSG_10109 [Thecamonas trahens ATCC 50062]